MELKKNPRANVGRNNAIESLVSPTAFQYILNYRLTRWLLVIYFD
ncbi:hypothetical protein [Winogradskyella sp.]|nr:hypothetical protein [Winogradskyella sp.]